MKRVMVLISLIILVSFLSGCGETVHGAVKDTKRIGQGIRKVFVNDEN